MLFSEEENGIPEDSERTIACELDECPYKLEQIVINQKDA